MTLLKTQIKILERYGNSEKYSGLHTLNLDGQQYNFTTNTHLMVGLKDNNIPIKAAHVKLDAKGVIGDTSNYKTELHLPSIEQLQKCIKDNDLHRRKGAFEVVRLTTTNGQYIYVNPFYLLDCLIALHFNKKDKVVCHIDPKQYKDYFSCSPILVINEEGFAFILPCRVAQNETQYIVCE